MEVLRVLVIEDDTLIALMLADMLSDMGHGVCATAATPAEAVAAARRHGPDLVISDVRLCSGSGIAAVEEILRGGTIPHMFITGDPVGVKLRLPDAVVVRKPFSTGGLAKAIEKALQATAAT